MSRPPFFHATLDRSPLTDSPTNQKPLHLVPLSSCFISAPSYSPCYLSNFLFYVYHLLWCCLEKADGCVALVAKGTILLVNLGFPQQHLVSCAARYTKRRDYKISSNHLTCLTQRIKFPHFSECTVSEYVVYFNGKAIGKWDITLRNLSTVYTVCCTLLCYVRTIPKLSLEIFFFLGCFSMNITMRNT